MEELKELLLRSFEEDLSPSEKLRLEKALLSSESLREEKEEIERLRTLLSENEFSFETGFADRVMDKVDPADHLQPDIAPGFFNVFKRIALSGVAAIILLLISIYFIDGTINMDSIYGLNDYSPEETELALFTAEDFK